MISTCLFVSLEYRHYTYTSPCDSSMFGIDFALRRLDHVSAARFFNFLFSQLTARVYCQPALFVCPEVTVMVYDNSKYVDNLVCIKYKLFIATFLTVRTCDGKVCVYSGTNFPAYILNRGQSDGTYGRSPVKPATCSCCSSVNSPAIAPTRRTSCPLYQAHTILQ